MYVYWTQREAGLQEMFFADYDTAADFMDCLAESCDPYMRLG